MSLFQDFGADKTRFKSVSLIRICMNDVLSKVTDRFLYLDADVVCLGDLRNLFDVKLDENIVAAVPDLVRNRLEIWGIKDRTYFNSGVLLVSCKNWENNNITVKALAFKDCNDARIGFPDQDILNIVIDGKVEYLDKKYNFFGFYGTSLESDCVIYHYIGREKPWNIAVRDVEKKWRYYLSKTPWPNLEDELPRKSVKNYFYFKSAAAYYFQNCNLFGAMKCYFLYVWLKICNLLTFKTQIV